MGHLNDSRSLLVQLGEQLHDLVSLARMQVAGWLIGQDQLGLSHDGPGHCDELLLPTRELVRIQILFPDNLKASNRSQTMLCRFALGISRYESGISRFS